MSNNLPVVSVGVPVYNEGKWIDRALNALLSQTYENIELIISDNASTDDTGSICRKYADKDRRVRYIRNEHNTGMQENFRKVATLSGGKYFMWAAADDWWDRDFIRTLVEELEKHPDAGLAMTAIRRQVEDGDIVDSLCFGPHDRNNPNNMTYLEMLIALSTNIASNGIPYHFFFYGLYRNELIKKAIQVPFPAVPAVDRLFMCQIALSSKVRYVDRFLHIRTIRREALVHRLPDDAFVRKEGVDPFAFTKTWMTIAPYLYASQSIPEHRKCLIPVASDTFMKTFWEVLYRSVPDSAGTSADPAHEKNLPEDLLVIKILRDNGFSEKAHELASSTASQFPGSPGLLNLLGEIKAGLGKNHRVVAKKIFTDIVKNCPGHAETLNNLAVLCWEDGQINDAIAYAGEAVRADKSNIHAVINLSKMLIARGDLKKALQYLEDAIVFQPGNGDLQQLIGLVRARSGSATQT